MTRATEQPLTLVAAAPGSGKTVLLTEWAASRLMAPAWVSLGPSDNEPSRIWPLITAAFRLAGLKPAAAGELDIPSVAVDEHMRVIDPYLAAAAAGGTAVHLVLDDAHLLTHPTILEGLDSLLRAGRSHVHLVLAARTDPLLPLHRYRLSGQMSELRARDLAMTAAEAQALLRAHHVTLSPREFSVLTARTEGWAAGLRLSAMSMEGAERPEEFVTEFALDQGSVGEYLMNEVLGRQPERVRTLLVETSFLPDVNAELAEAVTDMPDAGEMLAELSRTNAFVVPLDRTSGRFRYHQLLREMLRYLLRREPESHRQELFERASRWHYRQGEYGAALRIAVDGRDWARAAAMLVHGGYAQAFINHTDLRFMRPTDLAESNRQSPVPPDTVHELALARGALYAAAAQPDAARLELETATAAYGGPLERDVALTSALVELTIARAEHRVRDLEPLAAAIVAMSGDDESLVALTAAVELACGEAHFWVGHYDAAERLLLDALAHAGRVGDLPLELRCVAQLALFHAYWGRFRTSNADEVRARALMGSHPELVVPASLSIALALRAFYQADFDAAFASLRDAETTVGLELDADLQAAVPMLRGLLLASVGQVGSAQVALVPRADVVGTLLEDFRVTMLAAIETALGRPHAALKLLQELPTNPPSPGMALAGARAHLALGELRKAEDCLRPLLAAADTFAPRSAIVEGLVTQAQISNAGNDEERAVESLIRACELAAGDIVHPFVLVADDFREVVQRHSSLAALWPDIRLGPTQVDAGAAAVYPPSPRLPEPLTDRERTVLRWLSTTMSTREIAEEMCLSINTVKTHIAAIYRKLAAARRRDAVLRARTLELL
jgi:LuxR family maltose regulon positive regulatory protein